MPVTCKFKSAGLSQAIRKCKEETSKSGQDFINQTELNVTGRAINLTPAASRAAIQSKLGEVARHVEIVKKGKLRGRFRKGKRIWAGYHPDERSSGDVTKGKIVPFAALIINKRRGKAGLKGLQGAAMERAIRIMVGARLRSVGFEKSGWIPAVRALARKISKPFILANMKGIAVKGQNKGSASPANNDLFCSATIENTARHITTIGEQPLNRAMNQEGSEMERHLAAKLNPIINNFNSAH